MIRKILTLTLFFYILALLQTSFLVHFNIFGVVPNLILISVILISFFTPTSKFGVGIGSAFIGGFFLDVFSSQPFGWNVLILLAISILIKIILKRHIRPVIRLGVRR